MDVKHARNENFSKVKSACNEDRKVVFGIIFILRLIIFYRESIIGANSLLFKLK